MSGPVRTRASFTICHPLCQTPAATASHARSEARGLVRRDRAPPCWFAPSPRATLLSLQTPDVQRNLIAQGVLALEPSNQIIMSTGLRPAGRGDGWGEEIEGHVMAEHRSSGLDRDGSGAETHAAESNRLSPINCHSLTSIRAEELLANALVFRYSRNPWYSASSDRRGENWLKSSASSPTFTSYRDVAWKTPICSAPSHTYLPPSHVALMACRAS